MQPVGYVTMLFIVSGTNYPQVVRSLQCSRPTKNNQLSAVEFLIFNGPL